MDANGRKWTQMDTTGTQFSIKHFELYSKIRNLRFKSKCYHKKHPLFELMKVNILFKSISSSFILKGFITRKEILISI